MGTRTVSKGVISRDEAMRISPEYVRYVELLYGGAGCGGGLGALGEMLDTFAKLRRGQDVLTYIDGKFVRARVTSVNHNDYRAVDGPIVRVGNGEFTWRVDGSGWAVPIGGE